MLMLSYDYLSPFFLMLPRAGYVYDFACRYLLSAGFFTITPLRHYAIYAIISRC